MSGNSKLKNVASHFSYWLLAGSYFFYGAWDWRFLGLILASTVIDYFVGLALARSRDPRRRKTLVTTIIVANLALLGTFEYAGFFTQSLPWSRTRSASAS